MFGAVRVRLGEVCEAVRGTRVVKNQLDRENGFPVYQNCLTPMGYYSQSNRKCGVYVIVGGAAGEIGYSHIPFWAADDCLTISDSDLLNNRYAYYCLMSKHELIKGFVRKASVPRLSKSAILDLQINLPSLSEQERIVSILDKFEALSNSITEGLPKEIELRRKQYEYYRDLLLTFGKA